MKTQKAKPISLEEIIGAIMDSKSLMLFDALSKEAGKSKDLIKLGMSRIEYSRIRKLLDTGMVKRYNGEYALTIFRRVIYQERLTISEVIRSFQ